MRVLLAGTSALLLASLVPAAAEAATAVTSLKFLGHVTVNTANLYDCVYGECLYDPPVRVGDRLSFEVDLGPLPSLQGVHEPPVNVALGSLRFPVAPENAGATATSGLLVRDGMPYRGYLLFDDQSDVCGGGDGFSFSGFRMSFGFSRCYYLDNGGPSYWFSGSGRVTSILVNGEAYTGFDPSLVPEPATWATLIFGFGLVGAVTRRRVVRASNLPKALKA